MQCLWRRWQPCILLASPTSARKDFNPQPKLVLIYRPRKGERLSWPEQMWVNNLPKVITRQPSDTTGIWTWATRSWNRCANHSATAPKMNQIQNLHEFSGTNKLAWAYRNECLKIYHHIVFLNTLHMARKIFYSLTYLLTSKLQKNKIYFFKKNSKHIHWEYKKKTVCAREIQIVGWFQDPTAYRAYTERH